MVKWTSKPLHNVNTNTFSVFCDFQGAALIWGSKNLLVIRHVILHYLVCFLVSKSTKAQSHVNKINSISITISIQIQQNLFLHIRQFSICFPRFLNPLQKCNTANNRRITASCVHLLFLFNTTTVAVAHCVIQCIFEEWHEDINLKAVCVPTKILVLNQISYTSLYDKVNNV